MQLGPKVVFEIAGLPITNTLITAWGISLFLIISAFILSRSIKLVPGRVQAAAEMVTTMFLNFAEGMMPGEGRRYIAMLVSMFFFILISNIIGLVPFMENPTGDINTTVGYALVVLIVAHAAGIENKGIGGYIKGYFSPIWFLFPLNIIGEAAKPVSHSFRLFGNIVGGGIILTVLMMYVPWIIPVPLMFWFDLFSGVVQAFIFTMLSMVYIAVQK